MATITPEDDQPPVVRTGPMLAPAAGAALEPKRGRGRPPKTAPPLPAYLRAEMEGLAAEPADPATTTEDAGAASDRADNGNGGRRSSHFKPPTQNEDFWEWLSRFETDEWSYLIVYLWRVSPAIDSKSGGKPSNIRKFSTPFDVDTIREEEGSGHYRLDVCQINPTGAGSTRLAQHFFKILNMRNPPNVPPGEWLQRPENKEWSWAGPAIEANLARMNQAARTSPIASAAAAAGEHNGNVAMFTTFDEGMRRLIDMSNPTKILSTMREYSDMFKPPAADPLKPDPMLMVVGMMRDELTATRAELRDLRSRPATDQAAAAKPQSLKDQIGDLKSVLSDLRELSPAGGDGGRGPNWENIVGLALPEVAKITGNIVEAITRRPAAASGVQPNPVPIAQPTEGAQPMSELANRLRENSTLLYRVVPILADHFESRYGGTLESAAQHFQDWMFTNKNLGKEGFEKLRKTFTVDEIYGQVTTVPMLAARFVPIEDVRPFLEAVYADWEDVEVTPEEESETK